MKRKISTAVVSCLTCIGMLAYSALPVQAMVSEACTHPNFALGTDGPTGEYEYLESGHYEVWGMGHTCLKCGYVFYTDIHLVWESNHSWESLPSSVSTEGGVTTYTYDCQTSECDKHYVVKTEIVRS